MVAYITAIPGQVLVKISLTHSMQNAKISIHQRAAEPIFPGIQHKDLNLA